MATDILPRPVRDHSSGTTTPELTTPFQPLRNEKIVATGSGLTVGIALTEPVLYLQGYDQNDPSTKRSAILRGQLHLKVTKCVKIKKISICFRGHAQTDWPDGESFTMLSDTGVSPPKKIHFHDKKDLVTHGVIYFNHGDTALMANDYGAHYYQHAKPASPLSGSKDAVSLTTRELFSRSSSVTSLGPNAMRDAKRLSVQSARGHSRSFSRNEPSVSTQTQPQRNYRMFPVGDYLYSFEFPIDGSLPETIKTDLGSVKYDLEAIVERSGAFRPNLLGTLEIPVIRTPAEGSLEQALQIPIAFKLTPLAKVECHRIKVYVTENIQHWTADKSVHRLQPAKKVLLFEKRAESASTSTYPGSSMRVMAGGGIDWDHRAAAARGEEIVDRTRTNLLGNLSSDSSGVGPTEMEFNVQLPSCHEMKGRDEAQRLHFDTTYENIQINHWIKIVLRLSKVDERDTGKRRHFEISIDSPFHILSCKATQANIYLPAYSRPDAEPEPPVQEFECGCPGAPMAARDHAVAQSSSDREDSSINLSRQASIAGASVGGRPIARSFTNGSAGLARPAQAHLAHEESRRDVQRDPSTQPGAPHVPRPMHLLRTPSFAPPAFEDVPPPPPLVTPPPEYTTIVGNCDRETVLEDYFSRLSYYEDQEEDDRGRGRVDVPLTPGGRVNRSMDVPREWVRLDDFTST
ncbi:uncharacterized protein N7477_002708 [Penicillium maclennaniae]|uniref:uncharacterized protein n=1 Tax=Penicillium maclennaniae TaxID=1343394 RepID=UPI00254118BC|nr:uncharacterized protein N7477_002708 [Penicillium maclennaniae]KAJ5677075.1 hypothetical protein N7477_002708 [Penicillium maclennaniae]